MAPDCAELPGLDRIESCRRNMTDHFAKDYHSAAKFIETSYTRGADITCCPVKTSSKTWVSSHATTVTRLGITLVITRPRG